jgi:hypothetical protein
LAFVGIPSRRAYRHPVDDRQRRENPDGVKGVVDRGPYGRASMLDLTEMTIKRIVFSGARTFGVRHVVWHDV